MTQATPSPARFLSEALVRLSKARFFTVSALIHLLLILLLGSVVLFHVVKPPPDFTAAGTGQFLKEDPTTPPQTEPALPPHPQVQPVAPQVPVVPSTPDFLRNNNPSNPFSLPVPQMPVIPMIGNNPQAPSQPGSPQGLGDLTQQPGGSGGLGGGVLGDRHEMASAFIGRFYDLKQTRSHRPTGISPDDFHKIFRNYIAQDWRESLLAPYFRANHPIFTPQIFTPNFSADDGPKSFGLEKEVQPSRWLVHYRARVSPPSDGTYHFVGAGDDVMLVRFDGHLVLDRCWDQHDQNLPPEQNYNYSWTQLPNGFAKGPGFRAEAGKFYDMDVLIGEEPGGFTFAALLIQQDGVQYPADPRGNPILPVFRLADAPLPPLQPGQSGYAPHMDGGPVWNAEPLNAPTSDSDFDQLFNPPPKGL